MNWEYFIIGILLAFVIRSYFKAAELSIVEKQAREQEKARRKRIEALYGRTNNEK